MVCDWLVGIDQLYEQMCYFKTGEDNDITVSIDNSNEFSHWILQVENFSEFLISKSNTITPCPYWQCQLKKFQKFQIQKDAVKWMYRFNLNSVRVIGNVYCNEIPLQGGRGISPVFH